MKLLSWNVNGIRAIVKKGFLEFVEKENPDILCLQETKAHPDQIDNVFRSFPYQYWNAAEKKGYSGTVIFSKIKPLSVSKGMGKKEQDNEGRMITAEFEDYFLVVVYVPNSGRGLPRLEYRKTWDEDFLGYLKKLEEKKPVIVCGDLNVAHTPIDLTNPKSNYNSTAGYTQVEIDGFSRFLDVGFIDSFREFKKEGGHYTYWGMWNGLRARNVGWRIDYFLLSKALRPRLKDALILPAVMGSDHCPVGIVME